MDVSEVKEVKAGISKLSEEMKDNQIEKRTRKSLPKMENSSTTPELQIFVEQGTWQGKMR
jgi:hypothetical protein